MTNSREEQFIEDLNKLINDSALDAEFLIGVLDITKEQLIQNELLGQTLVKKDRPKIKERKFRK